MRAIAISPRDEKRGTLNQKTYYLNALNGRRLKSSSWSRSRPRRTGLALAPSGGKAEIEIRRLPLTLLVAGVGANDVHHTAATHDLAVLADLLNGSTNLHVSTPAGRSRRPLDHCCSGGGFLSPEVPGVGR